jgi:transcriptional regulator GlxA family with amidase domain
MGIRYQRIKGQHFPMPNQGSTVQASAVSAGRAGVNSFINAAVSALQEDVKLNDLLPETGIAFNTLTRNFKAQHGITPMHWLWVMRAFAAAGILAEIPGSNITAIAFYCGFSSSSHFTRKFNAVFEVTPSHLRRLCRNNELNRFEKRSLLFSLVKKKYHSCVPLIIESISQNSSIVSIFNQHES